jgi:hypothetical protein
MGTGLTPQARDPVGGSMAKRAAKKSAKKSRKAATRSKARPSRSPAMTSVADDPHAHEDLCDVDFTEGVQTADADLPAARFGRIA